MKKIFLFVVMTTILLNVCGCGIRQTDSSSEDTADNFYYIKRGETSEGISYSVVHYYGDEYARITGYTGDEEVLVFPAEIDGYPVKSVTAYSFLVNKTLKSVTFPESIEEIYLGAFCGCESLEEVILPDKYVYISGSAFRDTPYILKQFDEEGLFIRYGLLISGEQAEGDVVLPDDILEIADSAFERNCNIKSVVLPDGIKCIQDSMFCYCESLESVIIPEGVEVIENSVFYDCISLKTIVLPESVTEIQYDAFANSGLEQINIENVQVIGDNAFGGTPWSEAQQE